MLYKSSLRRECIRYWKESPPITGQWDHAVIKLAPHFLKSDDDAASKANLLLINVLTAKPNRGYSVSVD